MWLPLIRYELGDSVCLSGALCPEGRPFGTVTAIEGRTQDVLALRGEGGGVIRVHPWSSTG